MGIGNILDGLASCPGGVAIPLGMLHTNETFTFPFNTFTIRKPVSFFSLRYDFYDDFFTSAGSYFVLWDQLFQIIIVFVTNYYMSLSKAVLRHFPSLRMSTAF